MNRLILALFCIAQIHIFGQTSEKYNSEYAGFFRAEELFEKEQFAAARKEFHDFVNRLNRPNDPLYIKALYYEGISALELYNNDAVSLLENFNKAYPESIYKHDIYFRLAKSFYAKKDYDGSLVWFNKLRASDLEETDREEFYFKLGYANFKEGNLEEARNAFHEVKDGVSQYAAPALYYYSHIAYQNKSYQTALDGFLKLENDENFSKIVPYYIAQIYYLQGKYELVTEYAPKVSISGSTVNEKDMNHLIGDAFYRTGNYSEAVKYLEAYNKVSETTRDDDYQLGYAYFKNSQYDKAIRLFDRVKKMEDSLGQVAYYHIGECLLRQENLLAARSAFEGAAKIDLDPVVQEDALYNYAILSYKLDINPYDEAVEAFEMYLNKYPESKRKEDIYQYLVNVYTSTNNYTKALSSLDKLPNKDIRLKTAYQMVAFNQGVERFQKSDFNGAITSFKLVEKYPVDAILSANAVYWTADSYYRLNKYNDAISHFRKFTEMPAIQNSTLKNDAYYNIGYCYLKKEENSNAKEAFVVFTKSNSTDKRKKADAYMRIADIHYALKSNEEAVSAYQSAYELKSGSEDRALYYMSLTFGYISGGEKEKIARLLELLEKYPETKYKLQALFEVAKSYEAVGDNDKALLYYKRIVSDYPGSNLMVQVKLNIADIYFKQGEFNRSEEEYKKILNDYPGDSTCKLATGGLAEIYKSLGKYEKVEQLATQYPCMELSQGEIELVYFRPAINAYNDSLFSEAIVKFNQYLTKFEDGRYKMEIYYYMGNSYQSLGNTDSSITYYRKYLEYSNAPFAEYAAGKVSMYLYNKEQYAEAIPYYERSEQISSNPDVVLNARLGLMRSYFLTENWLNAYTYGEKFLKYPDLSNALKIEAHYIKGMSANHLNRHDDAIPSLEWLVKNTTTVKALEAKFTIAEILYKQLKFDESDGTITALLKMKPASNYWTAKALILRSKVYIQKDDLFNAEQTLKSVTDHYPVQDDGIQDEANELWNELMQLKNQPKSSESNGETVIEINEGGN